MESGELLKKRNLLLLAFCAGLVQIACYYVAGAVVRGDGGLAIAQPDTLLYSQAARRIAEGFPFSFSEGTAASTGTTSAVSSSRPERDELPSSRMLSSEVRSASSATAASR